MIDEAQIKIIQDFPIGGNLESFRASFDAICDERNISPTPDVLDHLSQEDLETLTYGLLSTLLLLRTTRLLRSTSSGKNLQSDLLKLTSNVHSNDFDYCRVKPLLSAALAEHLDDVNIWGHVYGAITESTPPPRPILSSVQQTPWIQNTSSFVNSSERHQEVDKILKQELGPLYVDVPGFCDAFFGNVHLNMASRTVFNKCIEGDNPLFRNGWTSWPKLAQESDVLAWFCDLTIRLEVLAGEFISNTTPRRKLLAQPKTPLSGSIGKRSMDIGFVAHDFAYNHKPGSKEDRFRWSQILVPGELKSNPAADIASLAWIDLATYAREVLAAQDTRRFVLGFTLCGSIMRVWEFDRLGGIASDKFNINSEDGALQFVLTVLGILWMDNEQLGFDPTIITSNDGERHITIDRDGYTERLYIKDVMRRAPCIAGRATTCWEAYRKEDPQVSLVIKDSWQYTDREEEGEYLREATNKGVINVARYYHHETIRIRGAIDDIQNHVRKGLDLTKARTTNHRPGRARLLPSISTSSVRREGQSSKNGMKRQSSEIAAGLPEAKRSRSVSPMKVNHISNRVHRRIVLYDYGKPIYKASSRVALLSAFQHCIKGHESLYEAGFLHRDISINNLMINQDKNSSPWPAFLIDLDLAIKRQRENASGARGKTGTRAFMAIGALLGEEHSFMHDLESFFWVLFWICVHYSAAGKDEGATLFDAWNWESDTTLFLLKSGIIGDESIFLKMADENFTTFYKPLIPTVNRLRRKVFPNGERWKQPQLDLYSSMQDILEAAQNDPNIAAL